MFIVTFNNNKRKENNIFIKYDVNEKEEVRMLIL